MIYKILHRKPRSNITRPNKCLGKLKWPKYNEDQNGNKYIGYVCFTLQEMFVDIKGLIRSLRRPDKTMVKK